MIYCLAKQSEDQKQTIFEKFFRGTDFTNPQLNFGIAKDMIAREISGYIREISNQFRVVSILGPRQSGKTTLARELFPEHEYVNFEMRSTFDEASRDLDLFMCNHPPPLIIDEVQRYPDILGNIMVWVDEHPEMKAAYVLTGSNQPHLRGVLSQSLAGRVGIAYVLPFSFSEVRGIEHFDRSKTVYKGFMPELFSSNIPPNSLYESYISTYLQRDVDSLITVRDATRFSTFLRLLAARVGQMLNYESMANELGVSANTVKDWISVLEASFVVFRLQPYYRNFGKRFVKTPKIYFTEVGLAVHLLGFNTPEQLERDPLFGSLFENMVVANIRKSRFNVGNVQLGSAGMYFLRDNTGNEVDVVLEDSRRLDLIEIKSGMSFNADYAKSIEKYAKIIGSDFNSGKVVYAGRPAGYHNIDFVNFADL